MSDHNQDRRAINRNSVNMTAVVKGRETTAEYWKERTSIVTVSRLGASFNLQRECKAGRILSLITNMPKPLRCYDHDKNLYRVWGLVQHCSPLFEDEDANFQVGIAFVGKHAPESYVEDPLKSYRIVGMDDDGFWNIGESKTPFVTRAHHRFPSCIAVRLAIVGSDGEDTDETEETVTDNISVGGALVFSGLDVGTGDALRFTCEKYDYSSIAVVRNRQHREGGRTTFHLEFTDSEFPIKEIDLPYLDQPEGADELEAMESEVTDFEVLAKPVSDSDPETDETYGNIEVSDENEEFSEAESVTTLESEESNIDSDDGSGEIGTVAETDDDDEDVSLELDDEVSSDEDDESSSDEDDEVSSDENDESSSDENDEVSSDEDDEVSSDENDESSSDENDESSLDENDEVSSDENDESSSEENDESLSDEDDESLSDENDESSSDEDDELLTNEPEDEHSDSASDKESEKDEEE